jgi:glycine/D-amino acid oxidase-like deaminating enzyme
MFGNRILVALGLLAGLRGHDFSAARSFMRRVYPSDSQLTRLFKFSGWALSQMFGSIPEALSTASFARPVSRTSIWLSAENPLTNHPWATEPNARLPEEVEVAVVGAGFTGSACAYHWSKQSGGTMAVLEMNEASSGASGRNEGIVVMGRYFGMVKGIFLQHLHRARTDLTPQQRDKLASKFASAYVRSAYKNADLIEKTVREEAFDCDYERDGWIQGQEPALEESVRLGLEAGFDDWTKIEPEDALKLGGIRLDSPAGFSRGAASWNPARWVWSLLTSALKAQNVNLYTHTKVLGIEDRGEHYAVLTDRGVIRARFVVNATESYSALLHPQLRGVLHALQSQIAFAEGGPEAMKPHVGLGGRIAFFGRTGRGVIFGSDGTLISYRKAGRNQPSRFITKLLIGEVHKYFGLSRMHVTREWSCTAGFTDDQFPLVGLLDGKRQYIIGGMCGSGSAVHFNGARHVVHQILGMDGPDDYPAEFFSPTRVLDPENHRWPSVED